MLIALGGYGRGMLSPGSDVDLLILHDAARSSDVSAVAERLLYPLWDAGLSVGHAVRTADECIAVAAERLDAATAMLDGRVVAGSAPEWAVVRSAVLGPIREDPRTFAERLVSDREARRDRFGSVSSLLEPDLKEGVGGLRDVHALGWLEVAVGRPLEESGTLREAERRVVDEAEEFLVRSRGALHLETGRGSDRLLLELQPSIAADLGYADEPGLPAVDGLMRSVFEHARQVEHVSASAFDRFLRETFEEAPVEPTPEGVLRAFGAVSAAQGVMPAASLDAMSRAAITDDPWSEGVRDAFLELLRSGPGSVRGLETLDRIGLLERYLPAWRAVRCRPQRDPYHRSSVDVHLLASLAGIGSLLAEPADDPLVSRAVEGVQDRDALLLGAFLHDIGKTGEGNHVAVGTRIAAETLEHMGVSRPTADLVLFLVAEHLLLSDTATRRDLEDERLVLSVADRIGDLERLSALLSAHDRRRRGHGTARLDAVAHGARPGTGRQGASRLRARRGRSRHRRAPDRPRRGDPRGCGRGGSRERRAVPVTDAAGLRDDGPARPRRLPRAAARAADRVARGAHPHHRGFPGRHLRPRGGRHRPPGPALDDRRSALARRPVDPHRAGVHDRGRRRRRPVRTPGCVRDRGGRGALESVPGDPAQGDRGSALARAPRPRATRPLPRSPAGHPGAGRGRQPRLGLLHRDRGGRRRSARPAVRRHPRRSPNSVSTCI